MPAQSKKKILVVDDEPMIRYLLTEALTLQGYDVLTAANGEDALIQLSQHSADLIICDCQMPIMDGFTFLGTLRQDATYAHTKIIMMSGRRYPDFFREKATQIGAQDFISKPFDLAVLLDNVAAVLA